LLRKTSYHKKKHVNIANPFREAEKVPETAGDISSNWRSTNKELFILPQSIRREDSIRFDGSSHCTLL